MSKDEILNYFSDINYAYNDSTRLDTLSRMLDELVEQAASPWHRVEDDPPDENKEAIFYYELTGISGTVYKNISIIYLRVLTSLGYRPISWMEKPEPPKEGA